MDISKGSESDLLNILSFSETSMKYLKMLESLFFHFLYFKVDYFRIGFDLKGHTCSLRKWSKELGVKTYG